jgi:hypothetical protein
MISVPGAIAAFEAGANTEPGAAADLMIAKILNNAGGQYGPILSTAFMAGQGFQKAGSWRDAVRNALHQLQQVPPLPSGATIGALTDATMAGLEGEPVNPDAVGPARYIPRQFLPGPLSPTFQKKVEGLERQRVLPLGSADSLREFLED